MRLYKKVIGFFILTCSIFLSVHSIAYAAGNFSVSGKHAEIGLNCASCHEVDVPEKRASQTTCRHCHGDRKDARAIEFSDTNGRVVKVNPHDTHAGDIRCTACHKVHEPSKLQCNEACHHAFDLKVP